MLAVVFAVSGLAAGFAQPASADDLIQDALKRKQELERAVSQARGNADRYQAVANQFQAVVNQTNGRIAELAAKQAAAQSESDQLYYQIQIAEEQLALVTFQLDETRALADSLKAEAAVETRELASREALYATHLRATYRQAMISPLEMLLASSSLTEFASRLQVMIFINRQDVRLANEIRVLRAETHQKQNEVATNETEILGLQEQVTTTRARLAVEKVRYDELVASAQAAIDRQATEARAAAASRGNAQIAANQARAQSGDLQRQLEQAEATYELLASQAAGRSGLGAFNGSKLAMWPFKGVVTSYFGPRFGGFHNGLDIAASRYTPVRATASGKVVTAGRPYLAYGDTAVVVIIAHGSNFSTLYGHLDDGRWPPVQVGQSVAAGQIIGYIGMTGWTTGPHTHLMAILNGRAVNPLPYLP